MNKILMRKGNEIEKMVQAEINEARAKQKSAQEGVRGVAPNKANQFGEYADILEKGLQLRKELMAVRYNGHTPLHAEQFLKQSTWKSLKRIMDGNKGILVVNDAVSFLTEMKVFSDREGARRSIYSTIHNHQHDFAKVRSGIYRLRKEE